MTHRPRPILTRDDWYFDTEALALDLTYRAIFADIQTAILQRRDWLYARYSPQDMTTYRIARLLGDYVVMLHYDRVTILPVSACQEFGVGVKRGPQTERYACFLWRNGWIPGNAYTQDKYWIMPKYKRVERLDWDWLESEPKPTHSKEEHRRKCTECEQWHDLTHEHWHRNKDGRLGWHSICKHCRNGVESQRIAVKRAA